MKQTEIKTVTKQKEVVVDIICDCCGNSCGVKSELRDELEFEYLEIDKAWGYYSEKDLQHWTAQICEKCVDEKFGFINFNKGKYVPGFPI